MNFVLALSHIKVDDADRTIISSDTMLIVTDKFSKRILLMSDLSIFSAND